MSEETKKVKVRLKICGSQFVITADESEQYIQKIAKMVDERVKYLDDSNPKLSLQMATIVAALNYCDQLEKERVITRELIKKADECERIARDSTLRLNKLLTENEQLKEEKAGLHRVIAELKAGTYIEDTTYNNEYTQEAELDKITANNDFNEKTESNKNTINDNCNEKTGSSKDTTNDNCIKKTESNKRTTSSPAFSNSYTTTASTFNSIKTTSTKLESMLNSKQATTQTKIKNVKNTNLLLNRDNHASIVTDEEIFNFYDENG